MSVFMRRNPFVQVFVVVSWCVMCVAGANGKVQSMPFSACSIETVFNAELVAMAGQSPCPVNVLRFDWESVTDGDLSKLAANIDVVIATGVSLFSW